MNVVVSIEHRFDRTPDGCVWTQVAFAYDFFWSHYLQAFDSVRIVARVRDVAATPAGWVRADGPSVGFAALPYYVGPAQYLRRYPALRAALRKAAGPRDAVILRVPSAIGTQLVSMLEPGRPYAVQVVGDPLDAFAAGATRHPLRPFFRWWFARRLREQCAGAAAAGYVTRRTLQGRYPCPGYSVSFSDVQIPEATLAATPRARRPGVGKEAALSMVTVGSMENPHKAVDVQIDALAECVRGGMNASLVVVGAGRLRGELEARAATAGVRDRVDFRGQLPAGESVRAVLDEADLFLLPSRTEGLPRAMIEAMARGLPCIGSTAGGIPELLAAEDLVPPGDAGALAGKIREVVESVGRMEAMSGRNLAAAGEFRDDLLRARRAAFYMRVRELTEAWLGTAGSNHP